MIGFNTQVCFESLTKLSSGAITESTTIVGPDGLLRGEAISGNIPFSALSDSLRYDNLGPAPWSILRESVTYENIGHVPWSSLRNAMTFSNLSRVLKQDFEINYSFITGHVPWHALQGSVTYSNLGAAPWSSLSNSVRYDRIRGSIPWTAMSNAVMTNVRNLVSYSNLGSVPWSSLRHAVTYENMGQVPWTSLANLNMKNIPGVVPWSKLEPSCGPLLTSLTKSLVAEQRKVKKLRVLVRHLSDRVSILDNRRHPMSCSSSDDDEVHAPTCSNNNILPASSNIIIIPSSSNCCCNGNMAAADRIKVTKLYEIVKRLSDRISVIDNKTQAICTDSSDDDNESMNSERCSRSSYGSRSRSSSRSMSPIINIRTHKCRVNRRHRSRHHSNNGSASD